MKNVKLYNVLFPVWLLLMLPTVWLVVLPGNFLIDSLVLVTFLFCTRQQQKLAFYKKHILPIFLFGFLADVIGAAFLFVTVFFLEWGIMGDELYLTVPAVLVSAACIFLLNYFVTFRRSEKPLRWKLALTFAIVTAPYTFMIPTAWFYGF